MGGRLGDSFALPGQRGQGGRSMDRFSRPLISHALGVGRPRTPLGQVDSGAQWRSWREGLRLANQQLGSLDGQFQAATLLHSNPFSQYGTLRRSPVLQVSFPSKESPEGRWTVTVLPRGIQRSLAPLSEAGQREITARWQQVVGGVVVERSWRLLRVQVGPVWNEGGGVEADLVGELVEDSLKADGSWADDEEVRLRMVVAVDGPGDALFLDGERQWRRIPVRDSRGVVTRRRIVEERITPQTPLALTAGRFLAQSTTLACNCPSHLGVVLWDWRARASALEEAAGRMGISAVGGAMAPPLQLPPGVPADAIDSMIQQTMLQTIGRRFTAADWRRIPADGCKHCHAVRWALGVPCAEPPDPPTPTNAYWQESEAFDRIEEFVVPLSKSGYGDLLATAGMRDAAWRDLDWMLQAVGAADAVSVTPGLVPLQEAVLLASESALRERPMPFAVDTGWRRFRSSWFPPQPSLAVQARRGDVWLGRGSQIPETFTGPGETAGEPFLLRGWDGEVVELLG